MGKATRSRTRFQCQACRAEFPRHLGRCPECQAWNSLQEHVVVDSPAVSGRPGMPGESETVPLSAISPRDGWARYSSGSAELDRVLGGGLIPGGYVLVGGDPGIGKSTLMLQVARAVAEQGKTVLYVAGEESCQQIKLRAERLGVDSSRILVCPETRLPLVLSELQAVRPQLAVIDSIQALYDPNLSGTPGNMGQVKECAVQLMSIAKALDITVLLVGHVTKEGMVAGPKVLEHLVDAVLYFEGDAFHRLRLVRGVKNRFGATHDVGVFEMTERGLCEVTNPSALFLSQSRAQGQPGSVIVPTLEGNRPLLVEIQALVGATAYATPRRMATGLDLNRIHQVIAVLERRLGLDFSKLDVYVNVVGGLRIQEPAADLAVALALVSSAHQVPILPKTVIMGEVGLTGEVRPVQSINLRLMEAGKLGFQTAIIPQPHDGPEAGEPVGMTVIPVPSLMAALSQGLDHPVTLPQDNSTVAVLEQRSNVP